MKSLLILGFKRSFSSKVYQELSRSIKGIKKTDVSDGEVINRNKNLPREYKYPHYAVAEDKYVLHKEILDKYSDGYLIKEVTQPYTILRYIQEHPGKYNVIYMDRNLDHIEFACRRKGWGLPVYPELVRMREELLKVVNGVIVVDKALTNPHHIFTVVRNLGYEAPTHDYITPEFKRMTSAFMERFEAGKAELYASRER